jgi:PHD/YefM family antitoxin component YafN of YafNO toxin-antitoxin module
MIEIDNIRSLTDFQRNAREHIDRLKETGKPEVLTVNGQAEVVVQSAKAYQELLSDAEFARSLKALRKSLDEAKRGEGRAAREVLEELARQHGFELRK